MHNWSRWLPSPTADAARGGVCYQRRVRHLRDAERLTDSYGLLLAILLTQFLLMPLLDETQWGSVLQGALMGVMLLLALRISEAHHRVRRIAQTMVAISLVALAVDAATNASAANGISSLLLGALVVACPLVILRRIFRHPVINGQTVLGAICVYLLLGLTFAFLYHGIWAIDHTNYGGNLGPSPQAGLGYFSYVTLATLGYGDIVPVSQWTRTTAMLEALIGQIFLVTLVAALVGNLGRVRSVGEQPDGEAPLSPPDAP